MFTYSAWMPCKQKHDYSSTLRYLKARAKGKAAAFDPYVHAKGKIIGSMEAAKLSELKAEILRLAEGIALCDLPADAERTVFDLRREAVRSVQTSRAYFDGREWFTLPEYVDRAHAAALQEWTDRDHDRAIPDNVNRDHAAAILEDHERMIAACAALEDTIQVAA